MRVNTNTTSASGDCAGNFDSRRGDLASRISQPEPQTIQTSTQRELFGNSNAKAELKR